MHDEDKLFDMKLFDMKLLMCYYRFLYLFLNDLEPQSSIYFSGMYGGCFLMSHVGSLGPLTAYNFPPCYDDVAYAQCLCVLLCYASDGND